MKSITSTGANTIEYVYNDQKVTYTKNSISRVKEALDGVILTFNSGHTLNFGLSETETSVGSETTFIDISAMYTYILGEINA